MVLIRKFFAGCDTMRQPSTEKKELNTAENSWHNPKLDHVSFGDFQDMEENLCDSHHDKNLANAKILAKESPAPEEKTLSLIAEIMKIWILRRRDMRVMGEVFWYETVKIKRRV